MMLCSPVHSLDDDFCFGSHFEIRQKGFVRVNGKAASAACKVQGKWGEHKFDIEQEGTRIDIDEVN